MSEHRLNGTYWPVGRDHPHLHRSGERCTVIGYDHDPNRDVALTFLVSFSDGLALHALPEEIDDSVPRTDDLWKPGRQRSQRGRYVWRRAANGHFETSFIFATYPFEVRVVELGALGAEGRRQFALCVEARANGRILARNFAPVRNPESLQHREEALSNVAGTVAARAHELDARDTARRQALRSPEPPAPGKEARSQ